MTLHSVTFFRAFGAMSLIFISAPLLAGTVEGRVQLINSHESKADRKKDFAGVVVWLKPVDDVSVHLPRKHAQMVQKDKKFTPHILAISAGTSVDFPNFDPIFHNAFSNFEGQIFDIGLYAPGSSRSVRFDRPGIVRVFCNIHPSMSAIIVVVDSPYFTTTDDDGSFSLSNVPQGTYELHFFHERATPETLEELVRTVSVNQALTQLPPVTISEAGYLPVGHKNKYGHDYPPGADEQSSYSSPLK
jgi:plastocyanin